MLGFGWFALLASTALVQTPVWTPCSFEEHELAFGPSRLDPARLRCGHVVVPEDRRRAGGPTIRLAFAVVRAEHPAPVAVPLVYLAGGPGAAALDAYSLGLEAPRLATQRDVILFDQRGTGRSERALCPGLAVDDIAIAAADLSAAAEAAMRQRAQRDCLDDLRRAGVDPGAYDMDATVADVEDLRQALGYERWSLLGRSYGGALAQRVMRRYPTRVHSAILVNPVPLDWSNFDEAVPDVARTLSRIYAECAADAACRTAFPDPADELSRVYAALQVRPWTVTVDTALAASGAFIINARDFMTLVDELLYANWQIPYLPRILRAFVERDSLVAAALVEQVFGGGTAGGVAVRYSVWCRDAVTADSRGRWERAAAPHNAALHDVGFLHLEVCAGWPVAAGPIAGRLPLESDIPTLVLSGGYDHVTSAAKGAAIAARLRRARHVVFPSSSHILPGRTSADCAFGMMRAFLSAPTSPPDTSCLAQIPPLRYSTELPEAISERLRR